MKCPNCQAEMPENINFCGVCGGSLATLTCPNCQYENPANFKFCGRCGSRLIALDSAAPQTPASQWVEAERRELTALFCDLVGSTAIAEQLDPEDLTELIRVYRLAAASVVQRYEGTIAQYQGDGILAYFGYPQAHEDDTERAVRAGLDIVDAIAAPNTFPRWRQEISLAVRIGIATGLVIATESLFQDNSEEKIVVGQTLNLAARLQSLATPNSVVISPRLRRQLGGLFEYEDLGLHALKGIPRPLRVWRALRPKTVVSRFEARHEADLTPLVNRENESGLALARWLQAKQGQGQAVLVIGEAGIGKSRLLQAVREQIAREPHIGLHYQCSPYYTNSTLYPFITELEQAAQFEHHDTPAHKLEKLERLLARNPSNTPAMTELFAALLALPGGNPTPALSSQRRKEMTLQAILAQIHGLTSVRPVLLVFEDIHWIDPTSWEALNLLIPASRHWRLLLLLTSRSSIDADWLDRPHVSLVDLRRLNPQHSLSLVEQVAGPTAIPPSLVEQIMARADGIPLFIEELTKTLVQVEPLRQQLAATPTSDYLLAIPTTLKELLLARLDQLSPAKIVAQAGSIIGREFSYELLTLLAPLSEPDIARGLQQLLKAELIYCRGQPPQPIYSFKHALVRDAAYDSLVRQQRQYLHARLAEALERRSPEAATRPELLAQHYTAAGLADKAVHFWLQAGQRAYERSANVEAAAHFRKGLEVLDTLTDSQWRREQELDFQIKLAATLITTRGPGSPEVEQTYARALELCTQLPESSLHFAAHWGWWRISRSFPVFRQRADQLLHLAEKLQEPALRLQAHHCQWAVLFNLGEHRACLDHIANGLALYAAGDYRSHAALYGGHDPAVCGHGEAALSLWLLGYPEQALQRLARALELALELRDAGSRAHAMDIALTLHFYRHDLAEVQARAEALGVFAEEQGFPDYLAKRRIFQGWALAVQGDTTAGIALLAEGIAALRAIGTKEDFPLFFDMLAEAYGLAGQYKQGLSELEAAFSEAEESGTRHWAAELYRRRGELLLCLGESDAEEAVVWLQKALETARQQSARSLELRAAFSLARFLCGRQQAAPAYTLLQPIYAGFSEGLDTADLQAAQTLLRSLRG